MRQGGRCVLPRRLANALGRGTFWAEVRRLPSQSPGHVHPDKRQNCGQRAEYTGFVVDTLKGRLLMMADKLEKLLTTVQEWMGARVIRARGLAKVRGKAVH